MDPPPQKLPLDVLGHIADILGAHQYTNSSTLRQLSLSCKFMVPICQRHLFSNISFPPFRNPRWRNGRGKFLLSHPTITMHYVKELELEASHTLNTTEYDLLKGMCGASSLTSIHISTCSGDWNKLPGKTKSVIMSLIQIPTLRHLTLHRINNFPAAAFSLCCGPTALVLHVIDRLAPPGADDVIRKPKITALLSLYCSFDDTLAVLLGPLGQYYAKATNTLVGFDRLREASFKISTESQVSQICKLLEKATCLEELRIHVLRRQAWPIRIGSSLAANPQPKLRHLTLDLDGDFNERDNNFVMYYGINRELKKLSVNNILEVLEVRIKVDLDTRTGPFWDWRPLAADFDKILTRTGAFPALRKVTVDMTWFILNMPSAYLGCSPMQLAEEDFPRLLENKEIDFRYSYECDDDDCW